MAERKDRPQVLLVNRCMVLNNEDHVLLIQRSKKDRYNASLWEFPGGKLDIGQDVSHALEREVLEETGLVIQPINKVAYVDSQILAVGPYRGLPYIVLIGIGRLLGGKLKLSEEHDDSCFVEIDEAFDYDLTLETRKALAVFTAQPLNSLISTFTKLL